jgi:signal transduction histidine kinase
MSDPAASGILAEYIATRAPLVFFRLSESGEVIEVNAHAHKVCGPVAPGTPFQNLLMEFTETVDCAVLAAGRDEEHLLNVRTPRGVPQTLYFTFRMSGQEILAIGRSEEGEEEMLRDTVLSLNRDLVNMTRALHKSNAELSALNQLKNQFLGMAAHDLRTPVGHIMSFSEFLLEDIGESLDEEHLDFLNTIHTASQFMKSIIDDFLDVSMIESGRFELNLDRVEITEVVGRGIAMLDMTAKKKGVCIETDFSAVPEVMADGHKLEQAFVNLLKNAVEHSPAGAPVHVSCRPGGEAVTVSVRDEGAGILPEDQAKLFSVYGRAKTKKTGGEKSSGLGLAIARKIIKEHGGRVWVESEPGKGSTFSFSLPVDSKNEEMHS